MSESFEDAKAVPPGSLIGRTLPHSPEAEERLLSCCLLDGNDAVTRCITGGITPFSFYLQANQELYALIHQLYVAQKPIDVAVLYIELQKINRLEIVGGMRFLSHLEALLPTTAQTPYYIDKVREMAVIRSVIAACSSSLEECFSFDGDLGVLTTKIGERVNRALGQTGEKAEPTFQRVAKELHEEVSAPALTVKKPTGEVSWHLIDVDRACGLMQPGNLVVVAGMPSTGKSALADLVAWKTAEAGKETVIFTYEMTKREKAVRIAQQISGINYDQLEMIPRDYRQQFVAATQKIMQCNRLHVFERDISTARMTARARSLSQSGKKIGLIVVDFLQYLARLEPQVGRERTDEKIGRITAAAKQMARDEGCPVMMLSSLNRDGYKDGNRPTMASLRASGEIESDADVIAILHWPKTMPNGSPQDPHDSTQSRFFVEFNQEKGRSKGVHQIGLIFDRKATRFQNFTL